MLNWTIHCVSFILKIYCWTTPLVFLSLTSNYKKEAIFYIRKLNTQQFIWWKVVISAAEAHQRKAVMVEMVEELSFSYSQDLIETLISCVWSFVWPHTHSAFYQSVLWQGAVCARGHEAGYSEQVHPPDATQTQKHHHQSLSSFPAGREASAAAPPPCCWGQQPPQAPWQQVPPRQCHANHEGELCQFTLWA